MKLYSLQRRKNPGKDQPAGYYTLTPQFLRMLLAATNSATDSNKETELFKMTNLNLRDSQIRHVATAVSRVMVMAVIDKKDSEIVQLITTPVQNAIFHITMRVFAENPKTIILSLTSPLLMMQFLRTTMMDSFRMPYMIRFALLILWIDPSQNAMG